MIEIQAVQPTAHEFRALTHGWGLLHWICCLPSLVYWLCFTVFGLMVLSYAGPSVPPELMPAVLVGTYLLSLLATWVVRKVAGEIQKGSPTGLLPWAWRIDGDGVVFDNGLQRNQVDWRAVKAVREQADRFVFLVTPAYNPVLPTRLLREDQKVELRALIAEVVASGRMGAGAHEDPVLTQPTPGPKNLL